MDRTILSIVQQPLKREFHLSDAQLGMLGGLAFALCYSFLGLPVARLADRSDRRRLIAAALVVWSGMTSLCGLMSGYAGLFLCRMGVSIGEAGAAPPAHSLIADYFPPQRRATAFSVYALGVSLGVLAGSMAGGWIAQNFGWRWAFIAFGAPGLALAILIQSTLKEPRRETIDSHGEPAAAHSLVGVLAYVARTPSLLHLGAAASLTAFAAYSINAFSAAFYIRNFGLSLAQAGVMLGLTGGVSVGIGTLAGGWLNDRNKTGDLRRYFLIPAAAVTLATPLYAAGFLTSQPTIALGLLLAAPIIHYAYIGPTFAVMHNITPAPMRATTTALFYLVVNIVGLGIGPTLVGFGSDWLAAHAFAAANSSLPFAQACPGGVAAIGSARGAVTACERASASGVRWALVASLIAFLWAAMHFVFGALALGRARPAKPRAEPGIAPGIAPGPGGAQLPARRGDL